MEPIYLVVAEGRPNSSMNYYVYHILKVYETTMDEAPTIHQQEIMPLYQQGRNISTFYFAREPDNPFRDVGNNSTL